MGTCGNLNEIIENKKFCNFVELKIKDVELVVRHFCGVGRMIEVFTMEFDFIDQIFDKLLK